MYFERIILLLIAFRKGFMCHKKLFHWAISKNTIKLKAKNRPTEPKSPYILKSPGRDNCFSQGGNVALGNIYPRQNPRMENLPKTKKLRLTSDFSLGHHGDWGAIRKMRMIGNFRVINVLNQVLICCESL